MNNRNRIITYRRYYRYTLLAIFMLGIGVGCVPESINLPYRLHSVTTDSVSNLTDRGATLSGKVCLADTDTITCGILYGTSSKLSFTNATKSSTVSNGDYSINVSSLNANTTYYYCAYALDAGRYKYGEVCSFKTAYEAIDLGLSVKWASCNVGAESPEDYGGYYAWGETEEKSDYSWATYKWCNGSSDSMTKYCTDSEHGTVDNKTTLDPEDDVAHVLWGDSWRMPTLYEINELCNKCSWQWTTVNGVEGYRVTGPNGNSIFLPAARYREGTEVHGRGSDGCYWSGTLSKDYSFFAYYLYFGSGYHDWSNSIRRHGYTVRPVTDK